MRLLPCVSPLTLALSQSSSGWEVRYSKSKNLPYFYEASTGTSRWQAPEGLSEKELQALPGAAYIWKLPPADAVHETHDGQVRASHLLVKHAQSRRAASWKNVGPFTFAPSFFC
jgi:NIMA-interacting peptidyl-prolyl cis-trans isomerase 1